MTATVVASQLWFQNSLVTIRVSACDGLPSPAGPPSSGAITALKVAATNDGIELLRPPLQ
jgi:hypothetical protein